MSFGEDPNATLYYVRIRGKIHGPFDVEKLKKLRARGQFSRAHEVSTDKQTWVSAGSVAELFSPESSAKSRSSEDAYFQFDPTARPSAASATDPPDNAKWYYSVGEEQHGPVSLMDLRQLVLSGQITPYDLVWKEGMGDWAPAANQPELQMLRGGAAGPQRLVRDAALQPHTSGLAIASLTLGIIGLLFGACSLGIFNILALVFGGVALRQIGQSRGTITGSGMAISGLVMGIIGAALWLVYWLLIWFSIIAMPHM